MTISDAVPSPIFDRLKLRQQRARAAQCPDESLYLWREVAGLLADRVLDIHRDYPMVLDLSRRDGGVERWPESVRARMGEVVACDRAIGLVEGATMAVVGEEDVLPFADGVFDLVVSCLSLQAVENIEAALAEIKRVLKPDGVFLAAIFGGQTLAESREVFLAAELAETQGASPRFAPMIAAHSLAGLMQHVGFALPVVDSERITVKTRNPWQIFRDLHAMGEGNYVTKRSRKPLSRQLMARVDAMFRAEHAEPDGAIAMGFEVIFALGWAPAESQPKPLRPGSARISLADIF